MKLDFILFQPVGLPPSDKWKKSITGNKTQKL